MNSVLSRSKCGMVVFCLLLEVILWAGAAWAAAPAEGVVDFPPALDSYGDQDMTSILEILKHRIRQQPFNLVATLIFFCAIVHTFLSSKFMQVAHKWEHEHEEKIRQGRADKYSVHHGAELFHFFGEVEVVFGLWAAVLVIAVVSFFDWQTTVYYIGYRVNYVEPMFVVTIMILAATRPILKLAEAMMQKIANLLGGTLIAWWFTVLTLGPTLGSLITEPAAMTISALLLSTKFYSLKPSTGFKYATLGLLFVNISVGGTLTNFAAPPVLMVAGPWDWSTLFMLTHFGWKELIGMLLSNGIYYLIFRKELNGMQHDFAVEELKHGIQKELIKRTDLEAEFDKIRPMVTQEIDFGKTVGSKTKEVIDNVKIRLEASYLPGLQGKGVDPELVKEAFDKRFDEIKLKKLREFFPGLLPREQRAEFFDPDWDERDDPVPTWVTVGHVLFMAWTIFNAHHPTLFVPGLFFFLGFAQVTLPFQNRIDLRPPLLVGFFLGGLVIHGGLQGWWIEPVLGRLGEIPLMVAATILTAFNDNAAITYLCTLVPAFPDGCKYAVVAGAVAGGGLTVIANAPNPAGQSLLKKHFDDAVSPIGLLKGALLPTVILWLCFALFR
ncbi:putative Na+/H+ antiporter [Desulfatitalea tepidiphila]|uniref:putative Na+/H+ antiporter n=1 Tax=Desulfatitalea tepidiphila TaxID=1185843 RepID=UPI001F2A5B9A|nr:putative Na+/H+ antiporter [Desulfatitalea tepidiphila]